MSSFAALFVATLAVLATNSAPAACAGPDVVDLGVAGNFAILSKTGVTDVPASDITGDVGASPITGAAIHLECLEVAGNIFTVDAAGPACKTTSASMLTTAISNMETAYTDAAGRNDPDFTELGAGEVGGSSLTPGLYKWGSSLSINADIELDGSLDDVYIFQVAGDITQASNTRVLMKAGATLQAKNIFWQVAGAVNVGTNSHFEGIILCSTEINLRTSASVNGRLLSQTEVTLQKNIVTQP